MWLISLSKIGISTNAKGFMCIRISDEQGFEKPQGYKGKGTPDATVMVQHFVAIATNSILQLLF
jgi:hypothetical protein